MVHSRNIFVVCCVEGPVPDAGRLGRGAEGWSAKVGAAAELERQGRTQR